MEAEPPLHTNYPVLRTDGLAGGTYCGFGVYLHYSSHFCGFSVDISAIVDHTPKSLLEAVSRRARIRRLVLGLTQDELSEKAGVSLDVVKRLESSGRISLETLARIAIALDASAPLMALFPEPAARSIDELEAQAIGRARVYGKRRDAGISRGPRSRAVSSSSDDESSR